MSLGTWLLGKYWWDLLHVAYYEFVILDNKRFVARRLIKRKDLKNKTEYIDKRLNMAFFLPTETFILEKSGDLHYFDIKDAKDLSFDEQAKYKSFHSLFGIKWETKEEVRKKIDKELNLYFVGVLPTFFKQILDTGFTGKIIKEPPNKWAWLEPYILPAFILIVIIVAMIMYGG